MGHDVRPARFVLCHCQNSAVGTLRVGQNVFGTLKNCFLQWCSLGKSFLLVALLFVIPLCIAWFR